MRVHAQCVSHLLAFGLASLDRSHGVNRLACDLRRSASFSLGRVNARYDSVAFCAAGVARPALPRIYNLHTAIALGVESQGSRNSVNIARGGLLAYALERKGSAPGSLLLHIEHSAIWHLFHVANEIVALGLVERPEKCIQSA